MNKLFTGGGLWFKIQTNKQQVVWTPHDNLKFIYTNNSSWNIIALLSFQNNKKIKYSKYIHIENNKTKKTCLND